MTLDEMIQELRQAILEYEYQRVLHGGGWERQAHAGEELAGSVAATCDNYEHERDHPEDYVSEVPEVPEEAGP